MRWAAWLLCATTTAMMAAADPKPVVGPMPFAAKPRYKGMASERRSGRTHGAIVDGSYAQSKKFPYQVYLRVFLLNGTVDFCGGAIISRRHILSAAHCVDKPNVTMEVAVIGSEHRFGRQALKFRITRQTFYAKTLDEQVDADIVVLTVNRPMPLGRVKINSVRLQTNRKFDRRAMCSVAGWGDSRDDRDPNFLKNVDIPLVNKVKCQKSYPREPPDDLLCAGFYHTGGADTCQGDSGSPLVCGGRLTGLVKGGIGCGLPRYPGTYTDVSYYWRWVKRVMVYDMRKENLRNAKKKNKGITSTPPPRSNSSEARVLAVADDNTNVLVPSKQRNKN